MTTAIIRLEQVSKTVRSGDSALTILHPLDLEVARGEVVAVVGPSGSGKSTLLGLVAGLDAPTAGRVVVDGVDITRYSENALAALRSRSIGIVFQSFHLVPALTALENVALPLEIAGRRGAAARARDLLGHVGLSERERHYPAQLSGGEQQRVAIARAFANDPPILLADEPTGNLDTNTGRQIIDLLISLNLNRGTTLVLVTHDRALAALAPRQLALEGGRVVEDRRSSEDGDAAARAEPVGEAS
jgi:putative ABC transport system ATP-binding protein